MIDLVRKILKVFGDHGLFDDGVALIGSWCFQLYQKHYGVEPFPLLTQDIDFLIPNPYRGKKHQGLIDDLIKLGFQVGYYTSGSLYLWNADFKIEFLTPEKAGPRAGPITLKSCL